MTNDSRTRYSDRFQNRRDRRRRNIQRCGYCERVRYYGHDYNDGCGHKREGK
jgi:hypothetical protein